MSRTHLERKGLVGLSLFMGPIAAVCGAILTAGLSREVMGMDEAVLDGSPFSSFTIPGLALAGLVGGSYLAAGVGLLRDERWATPSALVAGVFLMGFEVVEVATLGWLSPKALQPFCFGYGLVTVGLAARQLR